MRIAKAEAAADTVLPVVAKDETPADVSPATPVVVTTEAAPLASTIDTEHSAIEAVNAELQTAESEQNKDTSAEQAAEASEPRSRSRRSPRHLRAAGQKRRKEQSADATTDDESVADSAAETAEQSNADVLAAPAEASTTTATESQQTVTVAAVVTAEGENTIADSVRMKNLRVAAAVVALLRLKR